MKKVFSKILISLVMVAIFLMPVSSVLEKKNTSLSIKTSVVSAQTDPQEQNSDPAKDPDIGCGWNPQTWYKQCIVAFFYYTIFVPISALTELSAKILDWFVFYSINSNSYRAYFVEKAWSAVRDIANIFFILALLYIAIKTILGINTSNNKKYIAYVIIFSLLINFSLFTTKVVIDSTNILAHIFYNQINNVDSYGKVITSPGKPKSLTVQLVKGINPKSIIDAPADKPGEFFITVLLASAVCGWMIYMFWSVMIFFVSRVISLWMSMIFSPVAFASYAFPFKIKELGHDTWWDDLFSNAFLAPIFIFFLYVILMFIDSLKMVQIDVANSTGFLDYFVKQLVPFVMIVVLMMKAKDIAKKMAGTIGKMLVEGLKKVGGFALDAGVMIATAGIGGAAMAASKSGALASAASKGGVSGGLARFGLNTANKLSKTTMDPRKGILGKVSGLNTLKSPGLDFLKTGESGFKGMVETRSKKKEAKMANRKTNMSDDEVKAWSAERQATYNKEKEQAKREAKAMGYDLDEATYDRKNKPKEYTSAAALNVDIMKDYQRSLVKKGLFGQVALAKQKIEGNVVNMGNVAFAPEYNAWKEKNKDTGAGDQDAIKEINNERLRKIKMNVGGAVGNFAQKANTHTAGNEEAYKKIGKNIEKAEKSIKEESELKNRDLEITKEKEGLEKFIESFKNDFAQAAKDAGKDFSTYVKDAMTDFKLKIEETEAKRKSTIEAMTGLETKRKELEAHSQLLMTELNTQTLTAQERAQKESEKRKIDASIASTPGQISDLQKKLNTYKSELMKSFAEQEKFKKYDGSSQELRKLAQDQSRIRERISKVTSEKDAAFKDTAIPKSNMGSGHSPSHKEEKHETPPSAPKHDSHGGGDHAHGGGH